MSEIRESSRHFMEIECECALTGATCLFRSPDASVQDCRKCNVPIVHAIEGLIEELRWSGHDSA